MQETFKRELEIRLVKDRAPITFMHRKDPVRSEDFFPHLNNYVEIYIFISGDVDYVVEEDYISLMQGDVVVISPHEVHVPVIKSQGNYERLYMLLPLDVFSEFPFDPVARYSAFKRHKISLAENEKKRLLSLLEQISALAEKEKSDSCEALITGLFLQIHSLLLYAIEHQESRNEPKLPSGIHQQIREILAYIGEYATEIDSVGSIARHFYVSPQYLSSFFKRQVGINVNEYLRIKKTSRAKILLESGKSVAEAGYECGFSDSSHFIKIFKKYVGMTPKQYQNLFIKRP